MIVAGDKKQKRQTLSGFDSLAKLYNLPEKKEKEEKKDWDKIARDMENNRRQRGRGPGNGQGRRTVNDGGNRRDDSHHGGAPATPTRATATAPYNFVSLPKEAMPSALDQGLDWEKMEDSERREKFRAYIQSQGKNSGFIDLTIKTLNPCFIGGNAEESFAPAGTPILPGSTLRGMTKNLFKVITCGTMRGGEDFNDRHLYFRCIMAPKSMPQLTRLHDHYVSMMTTKNKEGDVVKKAKGGFLIRKMPGSHYFICPAEIVSVKRKEYEYARGYVPKDSKVDWDKDKKKAYILTGTLGKKPFIRSLCKTDWNTEYEVPENVIKEYLEDKNRRGVNLLDEKSNNVLTGGKAKAFTGRDDVDFVAPCFFIREKEVVTSFGHGRSYRLPYETKIGDHVPDGLSGNLVDYSDAVFGRKELWGSRVFFEDGAAEGKVAKQPAYAVKPLLSPNPTSFQLYLEQKKGKFPEHWDENPNSVIRGYKFYWHQKINEEWHDPAPKMNEKITHRITPIAPGTVFKARIRFSQLSDTELGALCKVFSLGSPDKVAFKLGQAKSLGLGSVRIDAALSLEKTDSYASLLTETGWVDTCQKADMKPFVEAYEASLGKHREAYERCCKELALLLDWSRADKQDWKDKIASMSGDVQAGTVDRRFVDRALLPKAEEVAAR